MDRRRLLLSSFAAAVVGSRLAEAQSSSKIPRLGCLTPSSGPATPSQVAFRRGLGDLGYVEGTNIAVEYGPRTGGNEQLRDSAAEFVRRRVDALFTTGTEATRVARAATTTIPIVSVTGDPVGSGFVASLARPGGNTTGLAIVSPEMSAKWIELVREILPRATRVADCGTGRTEATSSKSSSPQRSGSVWKRSSSGSVEPT